MAFEPENLGLSSAGLPLLRDLIHERTGLFYDNGRCEALSDRMAPLVIQRGFRSFLDFYYLLKYDEGELGGEWRRVMDALSVQETYFWREIAQIHGFVQSVLPALVRDTADRPIRIWSVPCATGEEPLTIAMALSEAGWFDRTRITIHASDASSAAIAKARIGRYRERSFRSLPPCLAREVFRRARWRLGAGADTPRSDFFLERRQPRVCGRDRSVREQPGHFLPQRVHLLLPVQRQSRGERPGGPDASALVSVRRRVRVAPERHGPLHAR